jgi:hypothetical protein
MVLAFGSGCVSQGEPPAPLRPPNRGASPSSSPLRRNWDRSRPPAAWAADQIEIAVSSERVCNDGRMSDMVLEIADLRRMCTQLLDAVERRHGPRIEFDVDYYWHIPLQDAFNVYSDPTQHVACGQVSDDLVELHHALDRSIDDDLVLWHDLMHLSGLLRALATVDLASPG